MTSRNRFALGTAVVLIGLIVAGAGLIVRQTYFGPKTITAVFTTARGIYSGDEVRVLGVKSAP